MALSDDQRAMLRLLAQREQGYEDMAALMGVSVEELRTRVKDALAQLEREGEEPPSLPEPPAAAAEPTPVEKPTEEKSAPAEKPAAPAPPVASEPPELSATPPSGQVPPSLPPTKGKAGFSLSSTGTRIALGAVGAAVAIVVVLLLVLGGGGSSDDTTASAGTGNGTGTETSTDQTAAGGGIVQEAEEAAEPASAKKPATKAVLTGSGDAHGVAIFGRVKSKLALQVVAEGLEPLSKGETYAIWIAASPQKMLPLAATSVSEEGTIASQFEVPTELLGYLAAETFGEIALTKTSITKLNASLKTATKEKEPPAYTGEEVMRGEITGLIVGAAKRLEEEEKAKGKSGE